MPICRRRHFCLGRQHQAVGSTGAHGHANTAAAAASKSSIWVLLAMPAPGPPLLPPPPPNPPMTAAPLPANPVRAVPWYLDVFGCEKEAAEVEAEEEEVDHWLESC